MEFPISPVGHVFIKLFNGKTAIFSSTEHKTIGDIKNKIINELCSGQKLNHSLWLGIHELNDNISLSDLLEDIGSISLTHHVDMIGGGKKRKKKQYTTPKKVKHKKKKVKLAVLKFYKLDGDEVVRLRKDCPAESCGRGVFMAEHHNRLYCGRCGLTYVSDASLEKA